MIDFCQWQVEQLMVWPALMNANAELSVSTPAWFSADMPELMPEAAN
jgi:hypothetical protein